MVEALGLIAALIAIGGFIWGTIRRLQPEKAKRAQALNEAKTNFAYCYNNWQEATLSSKHLHLLSNEDFKKVVFHKAQITALSENERLFMFVCSIVHGLWGDWIPRDIDPEKILTAVVTLLDGRRGWRPVWRSAYIVEMLTGESKNAWHIHVPKELQDNDNLKLVRKIISGIGVIPYLAALAKGDNRHLLDKSYALLQEIDAFNPGKIPPEFNKANVSL
ncbi:MAG: hypothetical protein V3V99_02250 [candidate division Zixibacteria bacterium]